jgi:TATA-box binding protein (TBP) (component of TFIID and TFIIIB)
MFDTIKTVNSTVTIFLGRKLLREEFLCIARSGVNSVYDPRKFHAIILKFRTSPSKHITALLFQSGRVVFTGGKNEIESMRAIQKLVKIANFGLIKSKFPLVSSENFCIRNVVFAGHMPRRIRIEEAYKCLQQSENSVKFSIKKSRYDPTIFPGLRIISIYKFAVIIFISGNFIVTGIKSYDYDEFIAKLENLLNFLSTFIM